MAHGEMTDNKKILVLHSYHQGLVWTDDIMEGIYSILEHSRNIDIYVEYMDSKRYFDGIEGKFFTRLRDMFKDKYGKIKLDVIISSDDNAFQFLLKYHDELFPDTPIVFCGVNDFEDKMLSGHELITGVVEFLDQKASIDIALKLHPDANQVAIITDPSTTGKGNRKILEELADGYKDRAEFLFLDKDNSGLTLQELLDKSRELTEKTIVYFSDFLRSEGEYIIQEIAVPRLTETYKRPIYTHYDEILGLGVVGGKLVNGYSHGRTAATMAKQILIGTPVSKLPVSKESINVYMFDYQQLKRFGIDKTELPEESTLINKPSTFYQDHMTLMLAALAIMIGMIGIVVVLSVNILRRKKAEKKLKEAHNKLELKVEERTAELSESNIKLQQDITKRKLAEEKLRGNQNFLETIIETVPT
jgi:hypothetical protein